MSDRKQHVSDRNHKKHQKLAPALTLEQQALVLVAWKKAQEEAKAERERIELFGKSLFKLSHRQLQGELRRAVKREYAGKPPQPQAGLSIALASILSLVLENTSTPTNPFGKLQAYPR
jgi:hypothetical protein